MSLESTRPIRLRRRSKSCMELSTPHSAILDKMHLGGGSAPWAGLDRQDDEVVQAAFDSDHDQRQHPAELSVSPDPAMTTTTATASGVMHVPPLDSMPLISIPTPELNPSTSPHHHHHQSSPSPPLLSHSSFLVGLGADQDGRRHRRCTSLDSVLDLAVRLDVGEASLSFLTPPSSTRAIAATSTSSASHPVHHGPTHPTHHVDRHHPTRPEKSNSAQR